MASPYNRDLMQFPGPPNGNTGVAGGATRGVSFSSPAPAPSSNPPGYTPKPGEKVNWGSLTPEQAGIKSWGAEIGAGNQMDQNMSPEQRARWSMEHIDSFDQDSATTRSREDAYNQWMMWQDKFDPNCPPNTPYQAEDGSGCVEKPDNTNRPGGGGGGGGRGGGGGGGNPMDVSSQANSLWDEIMNMQSRYSPEVMQRIMAGAKRQGATAGANARDAVNRDMIARGMGRSTDAANAAAGAARSAEAGVVNPVSTQLATEKVKADREDKIMKLQAMQNWINSARSHIQAMNATAAQKEVAMANLDLSEKRLAQELKMQQNQFDYGMATGAYGSMR